MARRLLVFLSVCAVLILVFSGLGNSLTCKEVDRVSSFTGGSDANGCAISAFSANSPCPSGYKVTGGGCDCDSCVAMTGSNPHDKGKNWACSFSEYDDTNTGMCQAANVNVRIVCCK